MSGTLGAQSPPTGPGADVYRLCMARTNIEIDDDLVAAVMAQNHLRTKREAVDFALRRTLRRPVTREQLAGLEGLGFGATLEDVRPTDADPRP